MGSLLNRAIGADVDGVLLSKPVLHTRSLIQRVMDAVSATTMAPNKPCYTIIGQPFKTET